MKPAPSPCSALFSAVTAEYSAHEDEHTLQLSRFRAFVLAVTEAREQLASSSSPVRGPGSTGVLVSARDNGKSENSVTVVVVLAASDKIREIAGRALGAIARTEDADFEHTRLIKQWEASGLILRRRYPFLGKGFRPRDDRGIRQCRDPCARSFPRCAAASQGCEGEGPVACQE